MRAGKPAPGRVVVPQWSILTRNHERVEGSETDRNMSAGPGVSMIEKFTFDMMAPRVHKRMIFVKAESEQRQHVVMKMLSYMLFYDSRLAVEKQAGLHYKPDLVILSEGAHPELWIDCGKVAVAKVENLTRKLKKTRIILVKSTAGEMERFRKVVDRKAEYANRLEYLAFENGFVDGIADSLERNNEITLYEVMEDVIGVCLNDRIFESRLYRQ